MNMGFLSANRLMFSDFLICDGLMRVYDLTKNKLFEIANGFRGLKDTCRVELSVILSMESENSVVSCD